MEQKFEYKNVVLRTASVYESYWHQGANKSMNGVETLQYELNNLSKDGWELVESFKHSEGERMFIFKRYTETYRSYNQELSNYLNN